MDENSENLSSSSILKNQLSNLHSISLKDTDSSSVIQQFESKVQENLGLKENLINLEAQLKISKESNLLQESEFAFRVSEYEAEIRSLKKIEEDLRRALSQVNIKNEDSIHDIEMRFKSQLDNQERETKDYILSIKSQVNRLRSALMDMQNKNESLSEDFHRYQQENFDLKNQLEDQKKLYEKKLLLMQNRINSNELSMNEATAAFRDSEQKSKAQIADLQAQLLAAQRRIYELDGQTKIFDDKEQGFNKQIEHLMSEHNSVSEQLANENAQNASLKAENQRLQNRINVLETELKTTQRKLAQIEDNTKESRAVSYCSPLQKTRIDILKLVDNYNAKMIELSHQFFPELPFKELVNMRMVILSVLFAIRWKNVTGKESEMFDRKGGLAAFPSSKTELSPIQLLIRAKNELLSFKNASNEIQMQAKESTSRIIELAEDQKKSRQMQEALALKLHSAKKCNDILHHQLNSFIRFHDAVVDYES